MKWFIGLTALALIGCNGTTEPVVDADGDGYGVGEDCDDTRVSVNPGAIETCNGLDDDCDGEVDENVTQTWFPDADGDGYGDDAVPTQLCQAEAGYVQTPGDCDDSDFDISPADTSVELCDDIDHNCDGDPYEGAIGGDFFWPDLDADGFGDPSGEVRACGAPTGYVPAGQAGEDCDDTDGNRNPGVTELCATAYDDNCDGTLNDTPSDGTEYPLDFDRDGYGSLTETAYACQLGGEVDIDNDGEMDARLVATADDCDDGNVDIHPGATEVCNGLDDDCDPSTDEDQVASDSRVWWYDDDGDGTGTAAVEANACTQPAGYVLASLGEDCDDADPARSPGEFETCDGVDNDCDGAVDNEPLDGDAYHPDADGDLLGDGEVAPVISCTPVPGRVDNDLDCDDNDGTVLGADPYFADLDDDGFGDPEAPAFFCDDPGAGYSINDLDCNDELAELTPNTVWYVDGDLDGYGTEASTLIQCAPPAGYAIENGDCNDGDPTFFPGAPDGAPADDQDNDCDGIADDEIAVDHCGDLSGNVVWSADQVHKLTCDVNVQNGATLTIMPGARVRALEGTRLVIGGGSQGGLRATGADFGSVTGITWDGIVFGGNDIPAFPNEITGGTVISGVQGVAVTIEGGSVSFDDVSISDIVGDGVVATAGTVGFENVSLSDVSDRGLVLEGAARLSAFADNSFAELGGTPVTLSAADLGALDAGTTYAAGTTPAVVGVLAGTIRTNTTWSDHGVDYEVYGDIQVGAGAAPVLTVEDGVRAYFDEDVGLFVGSQGQPGSIQVYGSLTDNGSGSELDRYDHGILFEGMAGTAGSWGGVALGNAARDSAFSGLDIRYAGGGTQGGGLSIAGDALADPEDRVAVVFEDSRVFASSTSGLVATNAQLELDGARLVENEDYGLTLGTGVVRTGTTIVGSTFAGNASSGARVLAEYVPLLAPDIEHIAPSTCSTVAGVLPNDFAGNTLPVEIAGGTVVNSACWTPLAEDYYVSGSVRIENVDGPIVKVTEGVSAYFGDSGEIQVGMGDQGSLIVEGTTAEPVLFTALAEITPATSVRGAWEGISFGANQRQSFLTHLEVGYAGQTTGLGALSFLAPSINPVVLDNVDVHDSGADGVYTRTVGDTGQALEIRSSSFTDNDDVGVNLGQDGLRDLGPQVVSFYDNLVTGNGLNGITVDVGSGGRISTTNVVGDNNQVTGRHDFIGLYGGDLREDMTLAKQTDDLGEVLPYRLLDGGLRVRDAAVLTIQAGVVLEVDGGLSNGAEIVVGANDQAGGIVALGSDADPIVFTSAAEFPTYGDWAGIRLGEECLTNLGGVNRCRMDHVIVEYAGSSNPLGSDRAGLEVYVRDPGAQSGPVLLSNIVSRHNLARGMMLYWDYGVADWGFPQGVVGQVETSGFACEDLDLNGVCDGGELVNYCYDGATGLYGTTNFFCDNVDGDLFARDSRSPYAFDTCGVDPNLACSAGPAWAN